MPILVLLLASAFPPAAAWAENGWLEEVLRDPCPGRSLVGDARPGAENPTGASLLRTVHGDFRLDGDIDLPVSDAGSATHWLIGLDGEVDASLRRRFEDAGVRLLQPLPENCWKIAASAAAVTAMRRRGKVRAVVPLCATDRFSSAVLSVGFSGRSANPDGSVTLTVVFFSDVAFETALRVLESVGARTDQDDFLTGGRVLATLRPGEIPALARADQVSWFEDRPTPEAVDNRTAATLSRVDHVQEPPYGLDGDGIGIGEWDGGEVQAGHPDFGGRVFVVDHAGIIAHATHVAGTLVGDGAGDPAARGMTPGAQLFSYDFHGDELAEMIAARAAHGIAVSSNSWGYIGGWHSNYYGDGYEVWFGDEGFGAYNIGARAWDEMVVATGLLIAKSAGNDRDDLGDQNQSGHRHYPDPGSLYADYHPPDGDWDCVGDIATAKNVITVGALTDPGEMTEFSAWGPCDDGRVKPDLMANGEGLWSTCPTDSYCSKRGTSMSTPVVGGIMALIAQDYIARVSADGPTPHFVRALLANTAVDLENPGPDYSTGWGLIDAQGAVDALRKADSSFFEVMVGGGEVVERRIVVGAGTGQLRVTAAWTDLPGDPLAARALVNDVDLDLESPTGVIHLPWVLDPATPTAAAVPGANRVDNVEQVVVETPTPGTWTIRLTGFSIQGNQPVVVVSSEPSEMVFADDFESGDLSAWSR